MTVNHLLADDCEEAVSTVIAMMLILAILATAIGVYTSTYLPGLKQQAEIMHNEDVKLAFLDISSEIETVYALNRNMTRTKPIELGGGDVLLNSVRSSGRLEISEVPLGKVTVYDFDEFGSQIQVKSCEIKGINISYTPYSTSWEKQGYIYDSGIVWVLKDNPDKIAPAQMTINSVKDGRNFRYNVNAQHLRSMCDSIVKSSGEITADLISFSVTDKTFTAGSGTAMFCVDTFKNQGYYTHTFEYGGSIVFESDYGVGDVFLANSGDHLRISLLTAEAKIV